MLAAALPVPPIYAFAASAIEGSPLAGRESNQRAASSR